MKTTSEAFTPGALLYIKYVDHLLFRDMNPSDTSTIARECVGWIDHQDETCVRIIWERYAMPDPPNQSKLRATGLVILKKAILEMRRIG